MIKGVLFDLDGTLADTAHDLGLSINLMLKKRRKKIIPYQKIRTQASSGARGLIKIGFNVEPDHGNYNSLREEFLNIYEKNLLKKTRLFLGVKNLLKILKKKKIIWGIVTNKPKKYTLPVLSGLNLLNESACVICGDSTSAPKPSPKPLLLAAKLLNLKPKCFYYVGDDERDIQAANAAGMKGVIALYGYLGEKNPPSDWGAFSSIKKPNELLNLLN